MGDSFSWKKGWHPGDKAISLRGDFKGVNQVAGWMGHGKDELDDSSRTSSHVARPISSLKSPDEFGRPPVRSNTGLSSSSVTRSEIKTSPRPPPLPSRKSSGSIASQSVDTPARKSPDLSGNAPYKPPPPPVRRVPGQTAPEKPPALPTRRDTDTPERLPISPPPPPRRNEDGYINTAAASRLSKAGISVPELGIARPPALPSRTPSEDVTHEAPISTRSSTVDSLNSRFSKLTTSQKPGTPSQGTSFAEKQHAWKTANSFAKDPSSVSLKDARTAASTANNFRQRHGEQVAQGARVADGINKKYGVVDKASSFAAQHDPETANTINKTTSQFGQVRDVANRADKAQNNPALQKFGTRINGFMSKPSEEPAAVQIESAPPPSNTPAVPSKTKKPPPPPPPKKKPALPPPIPSSSKPSTLVSPEILHKANQKGTVGGLDDPVFIPYHGAGETPRDLDLDLSSLWFTKQNLKLPQSIDEVHDKMFASSWSYQGSRNTMNLFLRWTLNLSMTKVRLTWDKSNPGGTVRAEQRHFAPPPPLTRRQLQQQQHIYGDRIVAWCESKKGTQVGNGECWTLARDALDAVANDCKARGEEPCMVSQTKTHGHCILAVYCPSPPIPSGGVIEAGVSPGDVLQFRSCHFVQKDASGRVTGQSWAGMPDHTSVVKSVAPDGVITVLEQNTGGPKGKLVKEGTVVLKNLVEGDILIYRPVGESWAPFDMTW